MHSARLHPSLAPLAVLLAGLLIGAAPAASQSYFEAPDGRTGNNATVIIPADAVDTTAVLEPGDEIGVFSAEGHCVGAAVWTGANLAITIWGNDELTNTVDGLKMDEPFVFHLWKARDKVRIGDGEDRIAVRLSGERPYYRNDMRYAPNAVYVVDTLRVEREAATDVTMR